MAYGYTARNQMSSVRLNATPLAGFTHALDGKRTGRTLANGTATGYDYDVADQLTAMRHLMNTTSLQRFDYVLDAVGNRTSRQESATGFQPVLDAYSYDPADQLTEVKYAFDAGTSAHSRKVTYSYDPAGNRQSVVEDADGSAPGAPVTVPYVANDLNQYTTIDGLGRRAHPFQCPSLPCEEPARKRRRRVAGQRGEGTSRRMAVLFPTKLPRSGLCQEAAMSSIHLNCAGISRRDFLQVGLGGALGVGLCDLLRMRASAAGAQRKNVNCIMIWMDGGPSHYETFDPKPDAPEEIRGTFKTIPTCVPGVHFSEPVPELAKAFDKFTVIRSIAHKDPNHGAGNHYMIGLFT